MTNQQPIESQFGALSTAQEVMGERDLQGQVVVITGGHSGIGLETTRVFARAGAKIYVGARDVKKAATVVKDLPNVRVLELDLSDPNSIDGFSSQFSKAEDRLHTLINNAGVMALPELTRDHRGYEMQFATNHLGHFQLTANLWSALKNSAGARVVNLTSAGHRYAGVDFQNPHFLRRPYDKWKSYGQSKSANALFTVALDKRGQTHNIRSFAVHPGRITDTNLLRFMSEEEVKAAVANAAGAEIKTIPQGAATSVWCAVNENLKSLGGVYCADCNISQIVPDDSPQVTGVRRWAINPELAEALWTLSESETVSFRG